MRQLLPAIFLFFTVIANSQTVIDVGKNDVQVNQSMFYTVGGSPVSTAKYVRIVDGSPFFSDSWMKGIVMVENGRVYDSVLMKLDLVDNTVSYIGPDGTELIATNPITQLVLLDTLYGNKYHFVNSAYIQATGGKEKGWYQLIASGKTTGIYKRIVKNLSENKPYGSATAEQSIKTSNQYFLFTNSTFIRVKKIKDIPDILTDKKNELSSFITSKNLSGKSDEDFAALITYYNNISVK